MYMISILNVQPLVHQNLPLQLNIRNPKNIETLEEKALLYFKCILDGSA